MCDEKIANEGWASDGYAEEEVRERLHYQENQVRVRLIEERDFLFHSHFYMKKPIELRSTILEASIRIRIPGRECE